MSETPLHPLFTAGWHAGFQEALIEDVHPDQDRCLVAWKELATERPELIALAAEHAALKQRLSDCESNWRLRGDTDHANELRAIAGTD